MAAGDQHYELTDQESSGHKLERLLAGHKIIGLDTGIFVPLMP